MQSVSSLIDSAAKPTNFRDPEYIDRVLSELPSTGIVEEAVAKYKLAIEQVPEGLPSARGYEELARLELRLARCRQRDELASGRPEGCWCLGIGGRQPRYTQFETKVFAETCGCPDGVRARQTQELRLAEERRLVQEQRDARLFGKAQVPTRFAKCTLDSYPVTDRTRSALEAIQYWRECPDDADEPTRIAWSESRKKSLLLHGPYGVGKTGLAVGILRLELEVEGGGLFFTVPTLLDHIRRTYGPSPVADEHEIVQQVKSTPFLVLDDLGAERVTEWVREKLFTIINHRHDEDLPTVFTSNLDVAELGQHIGERTTWRIVEMATVIHVDGPNLRK